MTGQPSRPVPAVDDLSRAFWTGGREGRLLISACTACGMRLHPPGPICSRCSGRAIEPEPVSGRGEVDGFTVVHRPWIAGYDTPYVVARVRLVEQHDLVLVTNIVDCQPDEVRVGMPVEVVFERRDEVYVPMFRPVP